MNTLVDTAKKVEYAAPNLVIEMASGVVLSFPVKDNPRLAKGSPSQLRNVEVSPYGLHWPELDEDLSFEGLLRGDFGNIHGAAMHEGTGEGYEPRRSVTN